MKLIKKIITDDEMELEILQTVGLQFDYEEHCLLSCIVYDRESSKWYTFGGSTLIYDGDYNYHKAFAYNPKTKKHSKEYIKICEVYVKEEFLGYTYGEEKIVLI